MIFKASLTVEMNENHRDWMRKWGKRMERRIRHMSDSPRRVATAEFSLLMGHDYLNNTKYHMRKIKLYNTVSNIVSSRYWGLQVE